MYSISLTAISIFFLVLSLSLSSAISINEIELNPSGADSGNEWIELYSDSAFSLNDYYLENEDGNIYNLSGEISNYLIISFNKQWLDNSKAIIYLKKDNITITQTAEISDLKDNNLTINKCGNSYILLESSKGEKNKCPTTQQTIQQNDTNTQISNSSISRNQQTSATNDNKQTDNPPILNNNQITNIQSTISSQVVQEDKIYLNNKQTTKTLISKDAKTRLYLTYFFTVLCAITIVLIYLRKL